MAIDMNSPIGQVRLLTADLDAANPLLDDALLEGYLALNAQSVYRAAADALDAMATSEVLLSRKIRTQDLQTDGPAVAAELRKQASILRTRADLADQEASGGAEWLQVLDFQPHSHLEAEEHRL